MGAITDILDRLSGVAVLKVQVEAVAKNVDRSLNWMLDHEKRLLKLEASQGSHAPVAPTTRRLTKSKD